MRRFLTIGHSSHTAERLVALLREHAVQVLVDTRSSPYSRFSPQFALNTTKGKARMTESIAKLERFTVSVFRRILA